MSNSLGIETTPRHRVSDATGILAVPCPRAPDDGQGDPSSFIDSGTQADFARKEKMVVLKSSEVWKTSAYFWLLPTKWRPGKELKQVKSCPDEREAA